ncbi:MAG: POTRA domain-containing protein, partial [Candidatus Acidiferrales bacterium]
MRIPWKLTPVRTLGRFLGLSCADLAVLGALACAWLLTAGNLRAQEQGVEGRRVAEIRVVDASGQAVPGKEPELPLQINQPFDFTSERESLRILYRTGNFSDIRVAVAPEGDALRVDFIVKRNYYNNVVRIAGLKEPPTEPAALAALRLSLGEPFRESLLREALDRLQDLLTSEGLYQARVTSTVTPHDDTRQMDVTVTVDPGPRARVGDVTIKNQTPYPDAAILRRSKLTQKTEITSAQFTRATQRLKKYLVDQGYLGAEALITPGAYDPAAIRVPLTLDVTAGPRVQVEISGARIRQSRLRQLLPIYVEGAVDEDLLQEGRRNIRDFFQREGYFDVDVQVTSSNDAKQNQRVIQYGITRGNRFKLAGVDFSGNKYFSGELLRGRLQLQPAAFAFSGRFSQQLVREDADSIRGLYLANGFREA